MTVDELKERFLGVPLAVRLLICASVGLGPGIWYWFTESEVVTAEIAAAQQEENDARVKFEQAKAQQTNLPKMEQELAFTEDQLRKAKAALPDGFDVEAMLEKVAVIAKESDVVLSSYIRGQEVASPTNNKFMLLPIKVQLLGSYVGVASFFDKITRMENSVFVRDLKLNRSAATETGANAARTNRAVTSTEQEFDFETASAARSRIRINAEAELVLFRSTDADPLSVQEAPAAPADAAAPPPAATGESAVEADSASLGPVGAGRG
jgi:Tfp pilus assembly protein PilO